jgi:hypothetical protein
MGGGLMQLVAYGAQDIYLTGNPQITFFKVVYRRHTNFSMESIEQTISGTPSTSGNSTVTISRNGDLVYKIYVTLDAETVTEGSDIVSEVELEIGGQRIDRHYKEWMQIWEELSTPESKAIGLKSMKCDIGTRGTTGVGMLQVPLEFWFCRNPGLALPLIALQYHEVKLKFTWGGSHNPAASKVIADYIYLDTDERRRFAQVSHEYLIEQVQRQQFTSSDGLNAKLNFNHPVKELIWTSGSTLYTDAILKLNGHDRFSKQKPEYFQIRQPYDYHTAVPRQNLPSSGAPSTITLFSSEVDIPADASNPAFTVTQPANTVILDVGLIVTDAFTTGAGDTGFDVGTAAAGKQICDGANAVNNDASEVIAGAVLSTGSAGVPNAGATTLGFADAAPLHTTSVRTIHGTVDTANAVTAAGKAKMFITVANSSNVSRTSQLTKKINVYSFALKPEEHQPSGTCNFSRIDNAQLNFTGTPDGSATISVYAVNYNVLRIMSGMGGLAYSN